MRPAVRAPLGAAMHGVLVKGFLLFRRELRVEILDGLVAGGHASLMLGLHGLHVVKPFRRRKTLKLGAIRALGGRGGRLALANWFHASSCAGEIFRRSFSAAMRLAWRSAMRAWHWPALPSWLAVFWRAAPSAWAEASPEAGICACAEAAATAIKAAIRKGLR